MLRLLTKTVLIAIIALFISVPLNASASGLLEATSQSINVLALPEPEISSIDAATNTVYLKQPDIELNDRMDLRAVVIVADDNNVHLQTKDVKVTSTDNIRIALTTELKKDYSITAKFTNHGIDSSGASMIKTLEPEVTLPEKEIVEIEKIIEVEKVVEVEVPVEVEKIVEVKVPVEVEKVVTVKRGGSRVETQYIVKEATPETVVVEQLVEALQPPVYIKGDDIYINGMPELEAAETTETTETVAKGENIGIVPKPIPLVPVKQELTASKSGDDMSNTTKAVIFTLIIILCALTLPILAITLIVYHRHTTI